MKGCIYVIKNKINDKLYIGQTTLSPKDRFKQHIKPSNHKKNYKIYKAMRKHGVENFYYEILEDNIPIHLLNEKEIFYIEKNNTFKKGYNSTKGGDGRHLNKIEDISYVVAELKKGRFIKDIAIELGISTATIDRSLKREGIPTPSSIQGKIKNTPYISIDRDDVKSLYLKGHTHKEIAETLKINQRSVSRIIKELGIKTKKKRLDYNELDLDAIMMDYNSGLAKGKLDKKYGLNQHSFKIIKKIYQERNSNDYSERK